MAQHLHGDVCVDLRLLGTKYVITTAEIRVAMGHAGYCEVAEPMQQFQAVAAVDTA